MAETKDGSKANQRSIAQRLRDGFQEFRRRHIFKVAAAYLIIAWLLMQVAVVLETSLGLPPWTDTLAFLLLALGLPIALIVAWAADLSPQRQADGSVPPSGTVAVVAGEPIGNIAELGRAYRSKLDRAVAPDDDASSTEAMFRRPVVAVLPFENMSGDPEQEYFADGLTEDIITALSLWRSFPVIARNSTFAYKGQSPDIREVGRELGAKYVLEGSVRKFGDRVRVTAQLINSENNHHIWAGRYDRNLADIFSVQDELSQSIAATVAPELDFSRLPEIWTSNPQNLDAWELVQRGFGHVFNFEPGSIKRAREYFERAITLDPDYARAYCGLAWSYHREFWLDRQKFAGEAKKNFIAAAKRAVSLDQFDSEAHGILSMACNWYRENDQSLVAAQRAVDLNPSNAQAHEILGAALTLVGRPIEGIVSQEKAVMLSPRDPRHGVWMWSMGLSYLTAHKYEEAVLCSERAIQRHPTNPDAHLVLASSLGHLGRVDEARTALDTYGRLLPNQLERANLVWSYKHEADNEHFHDGLRKAGWKG